MKPTHPTKAPTSQLRDLSCQALGPIEADETRGGSGQGSGDPYPVDNVRLPRRPVLPRPTV